MFRDNDRNTAKTELSKSEYRVLYRKMREELTTEDAMLAGQKILDLVLTLPEYKDSNCIAVYYSVKNEISTLGIIENAFSSGKQVVLPKIKEKNMDFYEITSLDDLLPGAMSIPEPAAKLPALLKKEQNPILFLPGIVFNKKFHRIGFGGGYYDRYLEKNRTKFRKIIALAYTFQVIEDDLPIEPFDVCPDMILTPERIFINEKN